MQYSHIKNENTNISPHNSENIIKKYSDEQKYKIRYSSIKRKELFIWMANASEKTLCEVMKSINPSPYKKIFGPEEARLHALLAAAEQVQNTLERTGRKNPERDLNLLEETHRLRLEMACRPKQRRSPKREKIALHEGIIRQLAAAGYSLRQIAAYLRREAGLKVTPSYLRQCCLDMEIDDFQRKVTEQR